MSGAIHGQAVHSPAADPIPEMQLPPMVLPAGEREVALAMLAAVRATRKAGMPPLTARDEQIVHTAALWAWNACREYYAEVTRGEVLRLLYDAEAETLGVRFEVAGGQRPNQIDEPAPAGGRRV